MNDMPDAVWEKYQQACGEMARQLPGWQDTYPSDPAVAVLELMAGLSLVQEEYLAQIRPEHYQGFLTLLGETPVERTPASLLAPLAPGPAPRPGQRFWVDGVPFEVSRGYQPAQSRLTGVDALGPCRWRLTFDPPLSAGEQATLWCQITPEQGRTPPSSHTRPPVCLLWQGDGEPQPVADGTCGLLTSGWLHITPQSCTHSLVLWAEGTTEGTPQVNRFSLAPVPLEQRDTRSDYQVLEPPFLLPDLWEEDLVLRCFAPEGRHTWREIGFTREYRRLLPQGDPLAELLVVGCRPDFASTFSLRPTAMEEVELERDILPGSLSLLIQEEDGLWRRCPVDTQPLPVTRTRGCIWHEADHTLRFGNGRDCQAPRGTQVLVIRCASTLGQRGNGIDGPLEGAGGTLLPLAPSAGGTDWESPEAAFARAVKEQSAPLRAVTCADYEAIARQSPGLHLARVKAFTNQAMGRSGAGVTVLAQPAGASTLTPWQQGELARWLDGFRLIGVPVTVLGPRYVPVQAKLSLLLHEPVEHEAIWAAVLNKADGVAGGLDFGSPLSHEALYAALGGLSGVRQVGSLTLETHGEGCRPDGRGGYTAQPDVLFRLEQLDVTCGLGEDVWSVRFDGTGQIVT